MAHISEKRWDEVSNQIADFSRDMVDLLMRGREYSIMLFLMYVGAGNTDEGFAGQLFKDQIAQRQRESDAAYFAANPEGTEPPVVTASAEEISRASDAREAMTVINELWEAANGTAITVENRLNKLRKMP